MTLKRSFSQRLKSTISKTKRIVSPSLGLVRRSSSTDNGKGASNDDYSLDSFNESSSTSSVSSAINTKERPLYVVQDSLDLKGLGLGLGLGLGSGPGQGQGQTETLSQSPTYSSPIPSPTHSTHTPSHSIGSLQRTSTQLIPMHTHTQTQSELPTLLYGKRRSNSTRASKSLRKHSLEYLDTAMAMAIPGYTATSHLPTPVSLSTSTFDERDNSIANARDDRISVIKDRTAFVEDFTATCILDTPAGHANDSVPACAEDTEVFLLPKSPVDSSIPPCTEEELTPIVPTQRDDSGNAIGSFNYFDLPVKSSNTSSGTPNTTMVSGSIPNLGFNSRCLSTTTTSTPLSFPVQMQDSTSISLGSISNPITHPEVVQIDVHPIFTRSNQIDHLNKSLDVRQNDLLADQMALNILQNINEESVDEISKLKEEIRMAF